MTKYNALVGQGIPSHPTRFNEQLSRKRDCIPQHHVGACQLNACCVAFFVGPSTISAKLMCHQVSSSGHSVAFAIGDTKNSDT